MGSELASRTIGRGKGTAETCPKKELAALQAENEKLQKHLKNAEQKKSNRWKRNWLINKIIAMDLKNGWTSIVKQTKKLRGEITTLQNQLKARGLT